MITYRLLRFLLCVAFFAVSATATAGSYTSATSFNGSPAPSFSRIRALAVDSSLNTWGAGDFQGGKLKFGTNTISGTRAAAFVFKKTSSGGFPFATSFETVSMGDIVSVSGIAVDSTGKVSVYGYFKGGLNVGGTILTSGSNVTSLFFVQLSSSGTILQAIKSTNTGNVGAGKLLVDGSDNVILTGTYSGTLSFNGVSLPSSPLNNGLLIKVSSSGSGVAGKATSGTGSYYTTIWSAALNPADGSIFIVGRFQNNVTCGSTTLTATTANAFIAKLDSSLNWLGALAPSFTGVPTFASFAEGLDIQVKNNNVFVTGKFQTEGGVSLNFGPTTLVSSGFDSFVAVAGTATPLAFTSANQAFTSDGKGVGLALSSVTGTIWNTGVMRNSANFSGTVINSAGYQSYLATVSPASVFANATSSTPSSSGSAIPNAIAIGSNGLVVLGGEFTGSEKFGNKKLTASSTSAFLVVYTP